MRISRSEILVVVVACTAMLVGCGRDYSFGDGITWTSTDAGDAQGGMDARGDGDAGRDAAGGDAADTGRDAAGGDVRDGDAGRDAAGGDAADVVDGTDACAQTCSGTCTDTQTDPRNCGSCGNNCVGLALGHATCVAGNCGVACNTGYHLCNGACVDDTSLSNCGALCSPCPADPHGSVTCDGTQCGLSCSTGYHACGGSCADNGSVNSCGASSCTPCSAPANGSATCDGTTCGITCNAGYALQGAQCVPIPAPRQIAPLSTATVTSRRPTLRWFASAAIDGAHVQLCRDRGMSVSCQGFDAAGTSAAPAADLAVGVWFWQLQGRSGGGTGTAGSAVWQFIVGARTATVNSSFGTTLDVNGDGYADVIVGKNAAVGEADVYLGGSGGLSATPARTLTAPSGSNAYYFGFSVASAGDVNGDGYADVVVGAYATDNYTGSAYVYLGGPRGLTVSPATTLVGGNASLFFGYSVASAGDVNGDGYADIVVGSNARTTANTATIFLGGSSGLSTTPATTLSSPDGLYSDFAKSVASAGDVNGDGYGDIVVGAAHWSSDTGRSYVYLGGSGGLSTSPATTMTGTASSSFFGSSVACAGDVNGDGYADIVVGAYGTNSYTGSAYIYVGGSGGVSATAATTLTGPGSSSYFGAVASAGDTNGDGYADVMVGAIGTSSLTGSAYVYRGALGGLSTTPSAQLTGPDVGSRFGISVASAGDVDGDGFADVVVGAENANSGAGSAFIYLGASSGLSTSPATTLTGSSGGFGHSVARAGNRRGGPRLLRGLAWYAFAEPDA